MTMMTKRGFSLIELLAVVAIFSVVMAGLYSAYSVQLRAGVKEYRIAESEMELGISRGIIDRDLSMAGYGLMDDYGAVSGFTLPRAVSAQEGGTDPDQLILMGTALGIASRASQGWTYADSVVSGVPVFMTFGDAREDVGLNDRVILMDPNTRALRADGSVWLFKYNGASANVTLMPESSTTPYSDPFTGMVVYGMNRAGETDATQPYNAVRYYLADAASSVPPRTCAPGTRNLLRAESRTNASPTGGDPMINCVLDFQVALGLDTDENGSIDLWDNGGATAAGYAAKDLNKRLKQIRAYVLVQVGNRDTNYLYKNPDPDYASTPDKIRVGDLYLAGGAVGRDYPPLSAEQRMYRWRVVSFAITPRNVR